MKVEGRGSYPLANREFYVAAHTHCLVGASHQDRTRLEEGDLHGLPVREETLE